MRLRRWSWAWIRARCHVRTLTRCYSCTGCGWPIYQRDWFGIDIYYDAMTGRRHSCNPHYAEVDEDEQ